MTIDRETVIRLAEEVGFAGYGEDAGMFSIPVPAFYSRLGRFATMVLEHERKPMIIDAIHLAAVDATNGTLQRIAFARGVWWAEKMHGITNKESSDAE